MKKKQKKIIGIDFDDTVFNFNDSLHAYHNAKYGTNVTRKDVVSFGIENIWKCTPEEASKKVFEFYNTTEHDNTTVVEGAKEALELLKDVYELHIISARGEQISDLTMRWIDKNFPNHFKSINLTNQYFGIPEKVCSKSQVCSELGIDIMIEDSLAQAQEIATKVERVYLLDCPWNQGEIPENVVRVNSWSEIIKHINKN